MFSTIPECKQSSKVSVLVGFIITLSGYFPGIAPTGFLKYDRQMLLLPTVLVTTIHQLFNSHIYCNCQDIGAAIYLTCKFLHYFSRLLHMNGKSAVGVRSYIAVLVHMCTGNEHP